MNTIIKEPKGFKQVETINKNGDKVISFEPIKESIVPENWGDFCRKQPRITGEYYIDNCSHIFRYGAMRDRLPKEDKNFFSTEQKAQAMLAFIQLIRIRDYVNGDWVADWSDSDEPKRCIVCECTKVVGYTYFAVSHPLHFKTPEIRDQFLTNFRDLIEEAKEFI